MSKILNAMIVGTASLATAGSFAGHADARAPDTVALTGVRIVPVVGPEIESGTVLIRDGKIAAVGEEVELPYDAKEVDLSGMVVMPGMIDPHSARGLDIPNENVPVAPFLNVYDAIDPSRRYFEQSLRSGVTTAHVMPANNTVVGGVSRAVRPIGLSVAEMTVWPDVAMKMSASPRNGYDRMKQWAELRGVFAELADYEDELAEEKYAESLEEDDRLMDVGPDEARERGRELVELSDYDDKHRNLARMKRGQLGTWLYAGRAMDVAPAVGMMTEQELLDGTVFVLGTETYKAAPILKDAGRPVVLAPSLFHRERDPVTGELVEVFVPKAMADAGIEFALQPNPSGSLAESYLNYQAAICVRNGLTRQQALQAVTLNPARMLGLETQLGSIEEGKTANLVVFDGDPLDFGSWVQFVYIDGVLAYDRDRDHRLQHLLGVEAEMNAENEADDEELGDETGDAAAEGSAGDEAGDGVQATDEGEGQ